MKEQKKVFGKNKNIERGSKRGIPMKAVFMIEIGGAVVLLALLLLFYVLYNDGLSALKPKTPTYQYSSGIKIEYTGSANFRNQDGVSVSDGKSSGEVVNTPLISDENNSLTLTCDMLLMVPDEGTGLQRIVCFSEVTENSKRITYKRNGKLGQSYGGFLYDGEDVYIFLEETKLEVGNVTYDLGPLSYAKVRYNQRIEFYDSITKEDKVIGLSGVDAIAESGRDKNKYRINLGKDVIDYHGQEMLLFSAVEVVDPIEMRK